MTNEEMIKRLSAFITCLKCETSGKECDLNCATQYEAGNMGELIEMFETIVETLEADKWILCSKRMPETNDQVSVTWVNHDPEVYYIGIKDKPFTDSAHYHNGNWYWHSPVTKDYLDEYGFFAPDVVDVDVEIVAWKPMPEPYKGGRV